MQLKRDTLLERGKYRILATLGQGGFGITYLAEQTLAGRKVCIKEYFPKDYYNRDADTNRVYIGSKADVYTLNRYKEKFIKEASVLARLKHPHIVSVYDVFEENDTAYYVMEHIEGESLGDVVKRRGALDEATAVGYIRQIASALGYIHEQNINHLDVKPGNVMVSSEDDSAILIDFGLAKHYDTSGGQTSSTPVGISAGFAPMEQYQQGGVKEFSPETDIYSLGATLYYLVTGQVPPQAVCVADEGLPELPAHLSSGVRNAIERSMTFQRKRRPHSAKEFLALLEDNTPEVVAIPTPKPTPSPVSAPISAPLDDKTSVAASASVADKRMVVGAPAHKAQPTPRSKKEPKPKRSKRGLWIMLSAFVVAVVASFVLLGGGSSETKQATKLEPPTKENAKPEATNPVTQPNNEIWYTSSDGKVVKPYKEDKYIFVFGAVIESNTYKNGKGIIKFKGNVTTIGEDAFYRCYSLTSVTIPNSVTTIGDSAFSQCKSLKSVIIPNGVTTIGDSAFRECSSLTSVTIPNSVTTIGDRAFYCCESLTSVTIPNSVTTIGEWAFWSCDNLTSVTIPNSVTTIGESAFAYCKSLTSITIPNSVTAIGGHPFVQCSSIKKFNGKFASKDGRCLIIDGKLVAFAPAGITEYTIPNSVKTIGGSAFGHCKSLKSVIIPNGVTTIGDSAFWRCSNLTSVTIPNSVKTIGGSAFAHCDNLLEDTKEKIRKINRNAL